MTFNVRVTLDLSPRLASILEKWLATQTVMTDDEVRQVLERLTRHDDALKAAAQPPKG